MRQTIATDIPQADNQTAIIGQPIADQELEIYHKEKISKIKLSDYRGRWLILFFYPADFTFVCPTELKELAEYYDAFKKEGAEIISVSTDTVYSHKAWHDLSETIQKIQFPMAADPTRQVCRAFGVYINDLGLARRGTFLIDPQGVLRALEVHDNSLGRSAAELLRKLQAAKFVAEHGGEVCPAGWRPGGQTLKPGLALVGKI